MKRINLKCIVIILTIGCFSSACEDKYSDSDGNIYPSETQDFRDAFVGFYEVSCTNFLVDYIGDVETGYIQLIKDKSSQNGMFITKIYASRVDFNLRINGIVGYLTLNYSTGSFTIDNLSFDDYYVMKTGKGIITGNKLQYNYDIWGDMFYKTTCNCSGDKVK
jgi:hypothetical protein